MSETMAKDESIEEIRAEVQELRESLVRLGRETVEALVDAWHARLDNLRVQVDLAQMDGRDDVDAALHRAETALGALRQRLDVRNAAADDVRTILREGVDSARAELQSAVKLAEERVASARG